MNVRGGAFVHHDIKSFDAAFFGLRPNEAIVCMVELLLAPHGVAVRAF